MDWLNISAEAGLWGLFASSFLAATLLPGGSELVLAGMLRLHPEQLWPALLLATLGNTLGGMTSYACGRWLPKWQKIESLTQQERVSTWGAPILLLAWTPIIGDALCVAAGWLRLRAGPCAVFMAIGKFARYWLIAIAMQW
ncbi:YqaA family protein [Propionivibrio dicarboxylicus]|uniref:Membrane protein YqaA, SNARE-associated domain n=1 Tax=Propionivibrio dicarboxylicus TaxID=83767 RepID=A0A1G7W5Z8_9RHOO|nr:YqaA family protein [Propionivibrio dicarboxylicus]SDG67397.1 membrane protein YqaA, SNARE-associated domain [Propionivibrio dicarboxylicus]